MSRPDASISLGPSKLKKRIVMKMIRIFVDSRFVQTCNENFDSYLGIYQKNSNLKHKKTASMADKEKFTKN